MPESKDVFPKFEVEITVTVRAVKGTYDKADIVRVTRKADAERLDGVKLALDTLADKVLPGVAASL